MPVGIQSLHHAAALLPLWSLLCLLSLEESSRVIEPLWGSFVSKWTVAKRKQKCHYSFSFLQTAEEWPRASMSAFSPLPLERVWMWNAKFGMPLHNSEWNIPVLASSGSHVWTGWKLSLQGITMGTSLGCFGVLSVCFHMVSFAA